jgi:hypothetical protein
MVTKSMFVNIQYRHQQHLNMSRLSFDKDFWCRWVAINIIIIITSSTTTITTSNTITNYYYYYHY